MLEAENQRLKPAPVTNVKDKSNDVEQAEKVKEKYNSHEVLDGADKQIALRDAKEVLKNREKTSSSQILNQKEQQERSNELLTPNIMDKISSMLEKISIASISVSLPRVGSYLNNLRIFPQKDIAHNESATEQFQSPERPAVLAVKQIFANLMAGITEVIGTTRSVLESLSEAKDKPIFPTEKLTQEARWMGVKAAPKKIVPIN